MSDISLSELSQLSPEALALLRAENLKRIINEESGRLIYGLYPETGPVRRELYPRHMEFFARGGTHAPGITCPEDCDGRGHDERAFIAGNRVGKTMAVVYETVCHAIGWYPDWWTGRRFSGPVSIWACGEDAKAIRESLQPTYLGGPEKPGTGLIPAKNILGTTARSGVAEAIDSVQIRHGKGSGVSRLVFKTYDQGRESYQGAKVDIVQFDEEPPQTIYSEGLTRTMSTEPGVPNGIVMCSFTPLKGISDVVLLYLPGGKLPDRSAQ